VSTPQLTIVRGTARLVGHALVVTSALLVVACGGRTNANQHDAATSGSSGPATGGSIGTGGKPQGMGGASSSGSGGIAAGGDAATGGAPMTGGTTASGGTSATGGTTADIAASPLERFCQGGSKAGRQDRVVEPPVTAYRLDMAACCAARYGILLHSHALMGSDYEIEILQVDPDAVSGAYAVGDTWQPMRVLVVATDDASDDGQVATGTVRITGNPTDPEGFHIGACIETPAGDAGQPPMMFHVPGVFIAPAAWSNRFAIYLLEDPRQTPNVLASTPLDSLVLVDHSLLDLGFIASVSQATGEVRIHGNGDIGRLISSLMENLLLMPFVVEADGERIYLGNFISPISSNLGDGPMVDSMRMSADRFQIEKPHQGPDPRWDQRILKVLGEANRLVP